MRAFDKAIEIDPRHADAWAGTGTTRLLLGRRDEALQAFDEAIEIDPGHYYAWIYRGFTLKGLGRHQEALQAYDEALDEAIKIDP